MFFDLPLLDPGDRIHVDRRDGTTVIFLVERIEQHPKNAFPTEVSAALTYSGGAKNG